MLGLTERLFTRIICRERRRAVYGRIIETPNKQYGVGELLDADSNIEHVSHACWNLFAVLELKILDKNEDCAL